MDTWELGLKSQWWDNRLRFNAAIFTNEYTDMIKAGIPDPAKVTRGAVENAASIGAMILTTEELSRGTLDATHAHPREIFRALELLSGGPESGGDAPLLERPDLLDGLLDLHRPLGEVDGDVDFL